MPVDPVVSPADTPAHVHEEALRDAIAGLYCDADHRFRHDADEYLRAANVALAALLAVGERDTWRGRDRRQIARLTEALDGIASDTTRTVAGLQGWARAVLADEEERGMSAMAEMSRAIRVTLQLHAPTLRELDDDTLAQFAEITGAFHADMREELLRRAEARAAGEGDAHG